MPESQNTETFTQRLRQRPPEDALKVPLKKSSVHDLLEDRGNVGQMGDKRLFSAAFNVKLAPDFVQFLQNHRVSSPHIKFKTSGNIKLL